MRAGRGEGEDVVTHAELVDRAAHWLRHTARCRVVLTEVGGRDTEIGRIERADALGWLNHVEAVLVECKTTISDARADLQKPHRTGGVRGCGRFRYYLMPVDVAMRFDVPAGWGLLRPWGINSCRRVHRSATFATDELQEQRILFWQTVHVTARNTRLQRAFRRVAPHVNCKDHGTGFHYGHRFCVYCGMPKEYAVKGAV